MVGIQNKVFLLRLANVSNSNRTSWISKEDRRQYL